MFLHELSEACYHAITCRNKMCPYQHKIVEKNLDEVKKKNDAEKKYEIGQTVEKNKVTKLRTKMFKVRSLEFLMKIPNSSSV